MRLTGRSPAVLGCLARVAARAVPSAQNTQPGCARYAFFIGVDGLSAGLLRGLIGNHLARDYANFRRFGYEGATTFNARNDYAHTVTLPNHSTAFAGRPVPQPAAHPNTVHHSYTND